MIKSFCPSPLEQWRHFLGSGGVKSKVCNTVDSHTHIYTHSDWTWREKESGRQQNIQQNGRKWKGKMGVKKRWITWRMEDISIEKCGKQGKVDERHRNRRWRLRMNMKKRSNRKMDKAEEVQRGEMEKANTWKRQGRTAAVPAQPEPRELLVNGVLIWRRWDFQSKHITKVDALLWAQVHCLHTPACFQHITNATPPRSLIPLRWIHLLIIRSSGFQRSLPLSFREITKKDFRFGKNSAALLV